MTVLIIFVVLAIGVSFVCSILEAVLLSITPSYVEAAEEERPELAGRLRVLRKDIDRPLSAILSLNTIAHTVGATGAGAQAALVFDDFGVGVFSALLTLGILVLSEIVPKTLGATYWRGLVPFTARTLPVLIWMQLPLIWMLQWITRWLKPDGAEAEVSREEIAAMATAGERLGVVEEDETRIVSNLLRLPEITASDVMTPRTVIEHVHLGQTVGDVVAARDTFPYSRLPVIDGSLDDVRGFVLTRDILLAALRGEREVPLDTLIRDLPAVESSQDLDALFDILIERGAHIALVHDEYGGTAGLVTLEDVLETLLGTEIVDENDEVEDLQEAARRKARNGRKET